VTCFSAKIRPCGSLTRLTSLPGCHRIANLEPPRLVFLTSKFSTRQTSGRRRLGMPEQLPALRLPEAAGVWEERSEPPRPKLKPAHLVRSPVLKSASPAGGVESFVPFAMSIPANYESRGQRISSFRIRSMAGMSSCQRSRLCRRLQHYPLETHYLLKPSPPTFGQGLGHLSLDYLHWNL